jgi:uncharacterized protein YqjF (DUF2071 family)
MSIAESKPDLHQQQSTACRPWPAPCFSPCTRMSWHEMLFMHWPVNECHLKSLLPAGVELESFDGQAWIGIVPFRMSGVAARWLPPLPWISKFPEVTVRTYVNVDGKPGLWYFSLDATNRFAVFMAKCVFALPYSESQISLTRDCMWRRFRSQRFVDGAVAAELDVEYRPIGSKFEAEPGTIDHWMTSRYCLYTIDKEGQILRGEIDHPTFKLQNAQAIVHKNSMVQALRLALPEQCPRLLYMHHSKVGSWRNQKTGCESKAL